MDSLEVRCIDTSSTPPTWVPRTCTSKGERKAYRWEPYVSCGEERSEEFRPYEVGGCAATEMSTGATWVLVMILIALNVQWQSCGC